MTTSDLQFVQVSLPANLPQLYFASCPAETTPGATTIQVAFLLPSGTTTDTPLGLQTTWDTYPQGCYVFLDTPIASGTEGTFAQNAWNYVSSYSGARFAWISNPNDPSGNLLGTVMATYLPQNGKVPLTNGITTFDFRGTQVIVGADCPAGVDSTNNRFTISQADNTNQSIYLLTESGQTALFVVGSTLALPVCGGQSGCLSFPVTLATTNGVADLAHLDAGLRTFYPDPTDQGPDAFYLASLRYPVLTEPHNPIGMQACLDPLAPLDASRTSFSFADTSTALPANYVTPMGYGVSLTPQPGAQLLFAVRPQTNTPSDTDPLYLTPSGAFQIGLGSPSSASTTFTNALMCGLSAVEYVDLQQPSGAVLTFVPGQSAFSPVTGPSQSSSDPSTWVFGGLTGLARTSWAYLSLPQQTVSYYAQPDSAVLHTPGTGDSAPFMQYQAVVSGSLAPPSSSSTQPFPLMPYKGAQSDSLAAYQQIETQVLSPTRRALIPPSSSSATLAGETPAPTPPPPVQGTTPQGLLLTLEDTTWESLVLAQTPDGKNLQIDGVTGALQTAFQSNKLFLVVSDATTFTQYCSIPYQLTQGVLNDLAGQNKLSQDACTKLASLLTPGPPPGPSPLYATAAAFQTAVQGVLTPAEYTAYEEILTLYAGFACPLAGWTFDLTPDTWQEHGAVLIFKYYDKSVQDLVDNTSSWAQAEALNDDVSAVQQQLQQIIADAVQSAKTAPTNFGTFVQKVQDPNWNGILALNCRVPLDGLPAQMEGLAAGIDPTRFDAHHIGFDISRVELSDSNSCLSISNTSSFGLIYYQDQADLVNSMADYDFKVLELAVVFNNSQIVGFSSQIELLMNRLFGEPGHFPNNPHGNNLILDGVYQQHDGGGTYLFSNNADTAIAMTSAVFNAVEITHAEFATIIPPTGLQAGQDVQTRFSLAGGLDFKALNGFDILSFGSASGFAGTLSYSDLSIDMSFDPDQPSYKTFQFDAQRIAFDLATSQARPDSVYNHFPIKLNTLVQAPQNATPATMGYMPVDTALQENTLAYPWYGLVFDLNLGTLGALAAKAGFTASLLAGWAPSTGAYNVFVGLKMPGVDSGKREIAIEEVFKITFGDIRFLGSGSSYILQLRNIAAHLLSLTFPPSGQNEILLFGDPKGQDNSTLGWYTAYSKGNGQQGGQQSKALLAPERE